jgi:hypothetical protein
MITTNLSFKRDRILDSLNEKWGEEDDHRNFHDLTHKPGEHGGLSLIPLYVRHRARLHRTGKEVK